MANTILITANWHTGALSQQTISRQYDNNRYVVQFVGYPEASEGNELDYYLLVWMSTAPGQKPGEITPIQLNSDQWYISNYFTQQVQVIKFQLCVLDEAGTYEAHSPIFTGFVRNSLEHDGTTQDIDVSTLFDAYREYLNELIIRSGAVVIDSVPTQGSTNAVSSGGVYESINEISGDINDLKSAINHSDACVGMITGGTPIRFSDRDKGQYIVTNGTTVQWDNPSISSSTKIKWAVVPFAGDRAAFHSNDLIYINYNKGSYTAMQIYKDGVLLQTITLPASGYQVDVSSHCANAGMYKARLTDGTNYSRYTYFEVIDTNVSATLANGEATIQFFSTNGTPVEWQIVEQSGATVCHNRFSAEEIKNGQVFVNPKAKMYSEKYIYPNRVDGYSATIYARVMFAGEYGNVVNEMIELGTLSDVSGELVFPNEPKDIGTISEATNVMLAGRMHGNYYSFSFTAGDGADVSILPSIGKIKWINTPPATLIDGTTYLVTVDNGIGNVVSAS